MRLAADQVQLLNVNEIINISVVFTFRLKTGVRCGRWVATGATCKCCCDCSLEHTFENEGVWIERTEVIANLRSTPRGYIGAVGR